ncbi:MAG: hypothetical protein NC921_00870, partial [Candidatus Omnitrophica bacterium]|nr:hypothetical protein [Candidatus Omnitrophota bacterium]
MKRIVISIFLILSGFLFSEERGGTVWTINQSGYMEQLQSATVRICGTNMTSTTDSSGYYTFAQPAFSIDKFILKVEKDGY